MAFTIELDNAFEHGFVHRTAAQKARGGKLRGPWLTSVVMWANCLRYVAEAGTTVGEVAGLARTHTNLDGVRRWGYVTVDGYGRGPASGVGRVGLDAVLRLTDEGRRACERWEPLPGEIEARWRSRFGARETDRLRAALLELVTGCTFDLPDCLPILGYGLFSRRVHPPPSREVDGATARADRELSLLSLLSRVLLTFALGYERGTRLSLAVMADVLRVLGPDGVRAADLPRRSGVSKEAIAMATKLLENGHLVEIRSEDRRRVVTLTDRGAKARSLGLRRIAGIESTWRKRVGTSPVAELRAAVEPIAGDLTRESSPLFAGLDPLPGGWRSDAPAPQLLPWFPMVLHRGGWPDGS